MSWLNSAFQFFLSIIRTVTVFDIIDIALVAFLFYKIIQIVRETRAEQLIKGILLFVIAYNIALWLNLKTMSFILINIMQYGIIALVVVFQPELRSALERIGSTSVGKFRLFNFTDTTAEEDKKAKTIKAVCAAAQVLQRNRIGALILLERNTKLGEIIKTGTIVNADITPELLVNVFYPKAPLHDGAMVIRNGRIYAAGCILPLSQNLEISKELGTRHRAALGISESTDVLVVVVSEETGVISLVQRGIIKRNLTSDTLHIALERGLLPLKNEKSADAKKTGFKVFGR